MPSSHLELFKQLETMTFAELQSSARLVELLRMKLNLARPEEYGHERSAAIASAFIDVLKDTLEDRYQGLSIRAFAHICVALDYYLDPHDAVLDGIPGGMVDDMALLQRTHDRFHAEIEKHRRWKAANP